MGPDPSAAAATAFELERPAGFLRRLGAMVYDALVVVALWMLTLFPIVAISDSTVTGPAIQSLLFVELFAFFAYFWLAKGQTMGMLAWRLSLRSLDGRPLRLRQALLRFVAALGSFFCLGLGHLWVLFDPAGRSWPDIVSHTELVYTPRRK